MTIQPPEWVKHAVFYQIFPDRFARSRRANLPPGTTFKPWGSPPEEQGFQGGDLFGIDGMHDLYDWAINHVQLNLLDSHDMARALWIMSDDKSALRLCVLFQMTMPGAPCIYYGDEIGLSSAGDPHCRAAFPWEDEGVWDQSLLNFYQQATSLRHGHQVLRTGDFLPVHAEDVVYAFQRTLDQAIAVVIFNKGSMPTRRQLILPGNRSLHFDRVWPVGSSEKIHVNQGQLEVHLPAREAVVLIQAEG